MSLLNYTIKRLLAIVPILFGVLAITFILVRYMPGSPFMPTAGSKYSPEFVEMMNERYGLNEPVWMQFLLYLKNIGLGDWGESAKYNEPVWTLIWQKVPLTLEMQSITTVLSSVLGIRAGVFSAVNQNNAKDTILRFVSFLAYSVPVFWIAQILQVQLCYELNWFPSGKYMTPRLDLIYDWNYHLTGFGMFDTLIQGQWEMFIDIIHHMFLPIFCLTLGSFAGLTRYVRSSMLETLELDYVRSARAKGCKERDVINKHALRNSMIPTVTLIGLSFGFMITGSMLTEQVFTLNGMGQFYLQVIVNRDYFVIQAMVLLITGTVILANLITDILYGVLDPRIRF
jgi:peptide/nickel transport system permease protein